MSRVNVMHANGEILFSFRPEHFELAIVRRMRAGQLRARIAGGPGGRDQTLEFVDESGQAVCQETVESTWIADPRDGDER